MPHCSRCLITGLQRATLHSVPTHHATPCHVAVGAYLPVYTVPHCSRSLLTGLHRATSQSVPTYRFRPCHIAVGAYSRGYMVSYSRSSNLPVACHMDYLGKCWRVFRIFNRANPVMNRTWGLMEICLQSKTFTVARIWISKDPNFQYLYEKQPASNGKKGFVHCSSVRCRQVVPYFRACCQVHSTDYYYRTVNLQDLQRVLKLTGFHVSIYLTQL